MGIAKDTPITDELRVIHDGQLNMSDIRIGLAVEVKNRDGTSASEVLVVAGEVLFDPSNKTLWVDVTTPEGKTERRNLGHMGIVAYPNSKWNQLYYTVRAEITEPEGS